MNIKPEMLGTDGKLEVYDRITRKYKRVAAVDAREQSAAGIISLREPPDVEMSGPSGRVMVKWYDVDNMIEKGFKAIEPASETEDPTSKGDKSTGNKSGTDDGGENGEGKLASESVEPFDFTSLNVDDLRSMGVKAGIANARNMKRAELLEELPKTGFNPNLPRG